MQSELLTFIYIIASVTFIVGLKMLSNPAKARNGNLIAAAGMTLAIIGTIFLYKDEDGNALHNYGWIFSGIIIGGIIGTLAAQKVKMTAMPEMVSLFNGTGGACAALISIVEFNHLTNHIAIEYYERGSRKSVNFSGHMAEIIKIAAGTIIGSISFAGSSDSLG